MQMAGDGSIHSSEASPRPVQPLDERYGAIVVGAGVVGLCVARYLQGTGRRVVVVERQAPGAGASGHNAGVMSLAGVVPTATPGIVGKIPGMLMDPLSPLAIRWSYMPRLAPWLIRFALASRGTRVEAISLALQRLTEAALEAYGPLIEATPGLSADEATRLRSGGLLYTYLTERSYAGGETGREIRRRRGFRFEVLDDPAIGALDPVLAGRFHRATYFPDVLYTFDPMGFTVALGRSFVEQGGVLVNAEATGAEVADGAVRAVITDKGRFVGDIVVVAAGAWSTRFSRHLGLRVPLDTERGYGVHLPRAGIDLRVPMLSEDYHFALVPAGGGALRLAGTDELAGLDAAPNFKRAERLIAAAKVVFPELRTDGAQQWMSYRPSMPDSLPVIGPIPRLSNAYAAFGHGHVGLTLAAITGRLICEMVDGRGPSIDLTPFRPTRFGLA